MSNVTSLTEIKSAKLASDFQKQAEFFRQRIDKVSYEKSKEHKKTSIF